MKRYLVRSQINQLDMLKAPATRTLSSRYAGATAAARGDGRHFTAAATAAAPHGSAAESAVAGGFAPAPARTSLAAHAAATARCRFRCRP